MAVWDWDKDREGACDAISRRKSPFKILLKTKDDNLLFGRWVQHHADLVGIENLIIFDNGSTRRECIESFEALSDHATCIRFSAYQDTLHNVHASAPLYEALRASCEYFCFLDTDEHLFILDEELHPQRDRPSTFFRRHPDLQVFPGTWLQNQLGWDRWFSIRGRDTLIQGLKWGKPIIRSDASLRGNINHNSQLPADLYQHGYKTNVFILHLSLYSFDYRINANLAKLRSSGSIALDASLDDVLKMAPEDQEKPGSQVQLRDIHNLAHAKRAGSQWPESPGIQIIADRFLRYDDDAVRHAVQSFVQSPPPLDEWLPQ